MEHILRDLKVMATDIISIGMDLDVALDWLSTSKGNLRGTFMTSGAIADHLLQEKLLKVLFAFKAL